MRAFILFAVLTGCAAVEEREARSLEDLVAARQADDRERSAMQRALMDRFLARAATRPTLDFLVISGGGDWGAPALP
jgi:hypothetical protein